MGIIDNAMVGQLGPAELSATGIANACYFVIFIFGIGLMVSVSTLVSKYLSQQRKELVSELFRNTLWMAFFASIAINIVLLIILENFHLLRAKPEVEPLAKQFLLWLLPGTPFLVAGIGLKNFMDGMSFTRVTMVITLSGVALNTFLNWILIYGNLGAPALGLVGSAVATDISRFYIFILELLIILRWEKFKTYRPFHFRLNIKDISFREIVRIGIPSGFQYFFEIAAFALAAIIALWISTPASAAHQIAIGLAAFTYMFATGLAVGSGIRTAHFHGQQDIANARRSGKAAIILITLFMSGTALFFVLFRNYLPYLFTEDPEVYRIATGLFLFAALFQLSDGIQCVSLGMLRGFQDVKIPTYIAATSYWVIALPLAYFFAFGMDLGINGLWLGLTIGLTAAAILLQWRFRIVSRR